MVDGIVQNSKSSPTSEPARVFAIIDSHSIPNDLISRLSKYKSLIWYTTHKLNKGVLTVGSVRYGLFGTKLGGAAVNALVDMLWSVDVTSALLTYDQMFEMLKSSISISRFGSGETTQVASNGFDTSTRFLT